VTLDQLLSVLAERNITLFLNEGSLRYRAPAGALTPELREGIASHRQTLIERLRREQHGGRVNGSGRCAFWDQAHWIDEPPRNGRIRTICRICGRFIGYRPEGL
jgi:hypothetical protein